VNPPTHTNYSAPLEFRPSRQCRYECGHSHLSCLVKAWPRVVSTVQAQPARRCETVGSLRYWSRPFGTRRLKCDRSYMAYHWFGFRNTEPSSCLAVTQYPHNHKRILECTVSAPHISYPHLRPILWKPKSKERTTPNKVAILIPTISGPPKSLSYPWQPSEILQRRRRIADRAGSRVSANKPGRHGRFPRPRKP